MENFNDKINEVLADLYELDPSFRQYEDHLRTIILELLKTKPDTKFDAEFAASLRRKLMAQAQALSNSAGQATLQGKANLTFMEKIKKNMFVLSGAVIAVVAIVVIAGQYGKEKSQQGNLLTKNQQTALFASKAEVTAVGSEAFGKLAFSAGGRGQGGGGGPTMSAPAMPVQESYDATAQNSAGAAAVPPGAEPSPKIAPDIMPYYTYKYVYKGEDFTVPADQTSVLRKVKGFGGINIDSVLSQLNFGLADIGSFGSMQLQSLNLTQDKEYGYNIYVNAQDGTLSISENWYKWPDPARGCSDEACYQSARPKISDIPDDQTVIQIADQFLADHSISKEGYGEPFVQNTWRRDYDLAQDKSQIYIPDVISVVYPLKLDGKEVYDEGGNLTGLYVNVNVRARRAGGISELSSQRYESSDYPIVTDPKEVIAIAERGGFYTAYYSEPFPVPPGGRQVEVALGTPHFGLVKMFQYNEGNQSELYVPSMIFPVTSQPASPDASQGGPQPGQYYSQNVVVPLARDLVNNGGGPIRIMK